MCRYPKNGSEFEYAVKLAKREIASLIRKKGYIRRKSELIPIVETLMNDFPRVQPVDVWGELGINERDERIR